MPEPAEPSPSVARLDALRDYLENGYEVFLVTGARGTGKTQLVDAYCQAGSRREGAPDEPVCQPVAAGRRKVVLVDAPGEGFERLAGGNGDVDRHALDLLRHVRPRLRGLVVLVDLKRLWEGPDAAQVESLTWLLVLLRWLEDGRVPAEAGRLPFRDHVMREVLRMGRLKVPVLVLFSRADESNGVAVPRRSTREGFKSGEGRTLFPAGEDPLLLAYHCLPELYQALLHHAACFRVDFVHALVTDPDTGEIRDPLPCGVFLSLDALLARRSRFPAVPSRVWIAVARFLDENLRRNDRWQRLPDPEELA